MLVPVAHRTPPTFLGSTGVCNGTPSGVRTRAHPRSFLSRPVFILPFSFTCGGDIGFAQSKRCPLGCRQNLEGRDLLQALQGATGRSSQGISFADTVLDRSVFIGLHRVVCDRTHNIAVPCFRQGPEYLVVRKSRGPLRHSLRLSASP